MVHMFNELLQALDVYQKILALTFFKWFYQFKISWEKEIIKNLVKSFNLIIIIIQKYLSLLIHEKKNPVGHSRHEYSFI